MPTLEKLIASMRNNPKDVRFADLAKICEHYFGKHHGSGSHRKYRTPWKGEPLVNIQEFKNGKAKPYQVMQVLSAIDMMEDENEAL